MTLTDFLNRPRLLLRRIDGTCRKIECFREAMVDTSAKINDMPRSSSPNLQPIEGMVCKIAELEDEVAAMREELQQAKTDIMILASDKLDADQAAVITRRYVHMQEWDAIVTAMHYSRATVFRLHRDAIAYLDVIWQNDTQ